MNQRSPSDNDNESESPSRLHRACLIFCSGGGVTSLLTIQGRVVTDTPMPLPIFKAADGDVYFHPRESFVDPPEYYVTDATFRDARRLTDQAAQRRDIAWSPGSRLIGYRTTDGPRLHGALYLPAGYEPGRRYPLVLQIYERMADRLYQFFEPEPGLGVNPTIYTSRGYAVLRPDIAPVVNDPGLSAVRSVTAAVKAAIATGLIDPRRIGIHGHSYGGFETAFIITQTNIFAAAVASAAPTNLISFYGSMYGATGKPNSSIYERDQLRFDGPYAGDRLEACLRNSAVLHAANVKTPLLLLHNDKDQAVDWNQGIEYFNILRRLGRPVIMLQYAGDDHTMENRLNRRDFAERMQDFFDHHLMDKRVEWITPTAAKN